MKVVLGVRRPSLRSDFNQNSNVSKVFNGTPQYDMSLKSIQEFSTDVPNRNLANNTGEGNQPWKLGVKLGRERKLV